MDKNQECVVSHVTLEAILTIIKEVNSIALFCPPKARAKDSAGEY